MSNAAFHASYAFPCAKARSASAETRASDFQAATARSGAPRATRGWIRFISDWARFSAFAAAGRQREGSYIAASASISRPFASASPSASSTWVIQHPDGESSHAGSSVFAPARSCHQASTCDRPATGLTTKRFCEVWRIVPGQPNGRDSANRICDQRPSVPPFLYPSVVIPSSAANAGEEE